MRVQYIAGVSVLALGALGGCATLPDSRQSLQSSATRLERSSALMGNESPDTLVNYQGDDYWREAGQLAQATHDFQRTLSHPQLDERAVKAAFQRVSQSYETLGDAVTKAGTGTAEADFRAVSKAYLEIDRQLNGTAAPPTPPK
jgi:hypothetical protein